jgi:3-hydroxyacyl-CoA dehydrogenase/enoyl-CoA hydratase/3-hydroxybutyryl-CoA epimerase
MRGSGFCDYDEEEMGRSFLFAVVIDSYKCLDSVALQEPKGAYIGFLLG